MSVVVVLFPFIYK